MTKDIVDAEWEILRLRGLKVGMLQAFVPRAVVAQTAANVGLSSPMMAQVRKHMIGVAVGDERAKAELEQLLKAYGLTIDVLVATAFECTIGPQLHADRMADAAYDRRNAAYGLLDGLRERRMRSNPDAVFTRCGDAIAGRKSIESPATVPGNGAPD